MDLFLYSGHKVLGGGWFLHFRLQLHICQCLFPIIVRYKLFTIESIELEIKKDILMQ